MKKPLLKPFGFAIILFGLFFSCSEDDLKEDQPEPNLEGTVNFTTHEKNLNIIYFVPTDNPEVPGYKERLGELLVYFQDWVRDEMTRNGYEDMTFGLPVNADSTNVKIITIQANGNQAAYDYESATMILDEIAAYRQEHPNEFSSSHHDLIILPLRTDGGRQPFYGWGRNCFAVDNPNIRVDVIETTTSNFIGGMLHELGHGLNLPHNHAKVSEEATLGTALMGSGNYSFGQSPTFLTKANATILSRNEIFQENTSINFYEQKDSSIEIQVVYDADTESINIEGTFETEGEVSDVLYWLDPKVSDGDADYNSVAWQQDVSGNTIAIEIPIDELQYKGNTPYQLKVKLLMKNGSINTETYMFDFVDGVPDFTIDTNARFYQHCSYGGYEVELAVGQYTTAEIEAAGIINNDVSGLIVPLGLKVTLYDNDNFTGDSEVFTSADNCVLQFNDKASSIKIEAIN